MAISTARTATAMLAGIGALLLATAPDAAAAPGQVALDKPNPQVGCGYKVSSAGLTGGGSSPFTGMKVTFSDNGVVIGSGTVGTGTISSALSGNPASVSWTPKTAGQHILTATTEYLGGRPGGDIVPLTVQVSAATSTGSFGCLPSGS